NMEQNQGQQTETPQLVLDTKDFIRSFHYGSDQLVRCARTISDIKSFMIPFQIGDEIFDKRSNTGKITKFKYIYLFEPYSSYIQYSRPMMIKYPGTLLDGLKTMFSMGRLTQL